MAAPSDIGWGEALIYFISFMSGLATEMVPDVDERPALKKTPKQQGPAGSWMVGGELFVGNFCPPSHSDADRSSPSFSSLRTDLN